VGGPLFIPHVFNTGRDKTFFFWNEEWRKLRSSAGTNVQNTIDPADIPITGQNLTYVPPGFAPGAFIVVPNISMSTAYYLTKLKPLGLTPGNCWNGPTVFDSTGNVSGCQDPQVIPASLFDSNGVLYLNSPVFPEPNVAGQDKNITNASTPVDLRDDIVRVDHKFNDKWSVLAHYMHDADTEGFAYPFLGFEGASYNTITSTLSDPSYSAAIKLSGTINPSLLVEASINYDGNVIDIVNSENSKRPQGWNVEPVSPAFTITRDSLPSVYGMMPYFIWEGMGSAPWHAAGHDIAPRVDISHTLGRHALKYGFSYNRYTKNQQLFGDQQGAYTASSTTNDSLMDILLGLTANYGQAQATPMRYYVNQTPSFYVMDNWHMTSRLSLQLGVRYDALPHVWERNNDVANFNPGSYKPAALPVWTPAGTIDPGSPAVSTLNSVQFYLNGMELAGVNGVPRGLVENRYNTVQPRVGFSYDLSGNAKTVLRGGFGTFYERVQGNDVYGLAGNSPFAYNLSIDNTYLSSPGTNWQTGGNAASHGFPIFVTTAGNLARYNYAPPAVAMYSLDVQHQFLPEVVGLVQYVGNAAWHQWISRHVNTIPNTIGNVTIPQPDGSTATVPVTCLAGDPGNHSPFGDDTACQPGFQSFPGGMNQFRQYQGYATIVQVEMATNGNYNGFQAGVRMQNRWGLTGEVDYTWSHEIDITSVDNWMTSNPWNLKYDKGSGFFDRRHILTINYVYTLPLFEKSSGLVRSLAGGWKLAGTLLDETGQIATVTGAGGIPGSGNTYDPVGLGGGGEYNVRPNISGKVRYPKQWGQWFDTSKFSNVVPVWQGGPNLGFGNTGKDTVIGPGRVNFTTSLYKSFTLTERAHFELRFESFNTFNHSEPYFLNTNYAPQNGPFSTVLNQGNTFGQVTSTFDPRVLELGGKFVF
jgi:hypothetical protein